MKKRFFAIYALAGALVASPVFTSCVEDEVSPSVEALRGAKAEQLKAAAALANAQAAAETTLANAEAALKAAQAEYQKALAANQNADAAYQEEMTKQAQEKFALEIARLQAQTEQQLLQYQVQIESYKDQLEDAEYNRFSQLYSRYLTELDKLIGMQRQLVSEKNMLAQLEANVISAEAWNQYYIKQQERYIASYEAQIALLKDPAYTALENEELYAQYQVANKEVQLAKKAFNASEACSNLLATSKALEEALNANNELKDAINTINTENNYIVNYSWEVTEYWYVYNSVNYDYKNWGWSGNTSYYKDIRIDESNKLQRTRVLANEVELYATWLGKADDTKDKDTAYGRLAAAKAGLTAANEAMTAAKAMPETTDAEKEAKQLKIAEAEGLIYDAETLIAQRTDELPNYQKWYDNAVEEQTKFTEALAAFDVEAANAVGEALVAAIEANNEADEAYEEAREAVAEKENVANTLWNLYSNAGINVAEQILNLEANIENCKVRIEGYKVNNAEQTLANAKEDIANLEAEIAVQEKIVADAKAAVDVYLAEEETPAE